MVRQNLKSPSKLRNREYESFAESSANLPWGKPNFYSTESTRRVDFRKDAVDRICRASLPRNYRMRLTPKENDRRQGEN